MRVLVCLLMCYLPAQAKDWYVSPAGNDSNAGTISAPFKTPAKCESVMANGDTCFIRAGTYNMPLNSPTISGQKTMAQYGTEIVDLIMADGAMVRFTGVASTWDAPNLTLAHMMALGRLGSVPNPTGLTYVSLYIDGSLVAVNMGSSLPLLLSYTFKPKGRNPASIQIQVTQ